MRKRIIFKFGEQANGSKGRFSVTWVRCIALCLTLFMILQCSSAEMIMATGNSNFESETEYICGLTEHVHFENCYYQELICGLEEGILPEPSTEALPDDTSDWDGLSEDITTIDTLTEEIIYSHTHSPECYETELVCELAVHLHDFKCETLEVIEEEVSGYVCELLEHEHTEDYCYGYALACFWEASDYHKHTTDCYEYTLICSVFPHIHTDNCYVKGQPFSHMTNNSLRSRSGPSPFASESSNLNEFADGVKIYRLVNGQRILLNPGEEVHIGENYVFYISFREISAGTQFKYANGYLTYTLPDEIIVPDGLKGKTISIMGTGAVVGEYTISGDGESIKVKFYDVDVKGNYTGGTNFIDLYKNTFFYVEFQGQFSEEAGHTEIDFGDNCTVDVNLKPKSAELDIEKKSFVYNPVSKTVDYEIIVTSLYGKSENIVVYDKLNFPTDIGNITIDFSKLYTNVTYQIMRNGIWTTYTPTPDIHSIYSNQLKIDFGGDFSLEANEQVKIKYTLDLTTIFKDNVISAESFILKNTARVGEGDDGPTTTEETVISNKMVWKDGSVIRVGETLTATWNAYVGNGSVSLNGWKITDTLTTTGGLHTFNTDSIKVWVYPKRGEGETDASWKSRAQEVSNPVITFSTDSNGNPIFTYTVPEDGYIFDSNPPKAPIYRVEFKYTTTGNNVNATLTNEMIAEKDNNKYSDSESVRIGPDNELHKYSVMDSESREIAYKIIAKVDEQYHGKKIVIGDLLGIYPYGIHRWALIDEWVLMDEWGDTQDRKRIGSLKITPDFLNDRTTITVSNPDGTDPEILNSNEYEWIENINDYAGYNDPGSDDIYGNQIYNYFLVFGEGADNVDDSKWQYADKILTITYSIPFDTPLEVEGLDEKYSNYKTVEDILKADLDNDDEYDCQIRNFAELLEYRPWWDNDNKARGWFNWLQSGTVCDVWPIVKTAGNSYTDDAGNVYFPYIVKVNPSHYQDVFRNPSSFFIDTFDSRLEYVQGTFGGWIYWGEGDQDGYLAYCNPNDTLPVKDNNDGTKTLKVMLSQDLGYKGDDGIPWWSDPYWHYSLTQSSNMEGGMAYTFRYTLKLPADEVAKITEKVAFDNTAGFLASGNDLKGPYSDDCTITYSSEVVDKKMGIIPYSNVATVSIEINPNGLELAPSAPIIQVVDKMSDTLAFNLSSIKVYEIKANGEKILQVNTLGNRETDKDTPWKYYFSGDNTITFNIPDKTHVVIEYTALIKGEDGASVEVSNEVSVTGGFSDSVIRKFTVVEAYGGAGGSLDEFQIIKQDGLTGAGLEGAKFELYVLGENTGGSTITVGDYIFYKITTDPLIITDSGGSFVIPANVFTGYTHSDIFLLREVTAPNGYPAPPTTFTENTLYLEAPDAWDTLFTFGSTVNLPEPYKTHVKMQVGDYIIIQNTPANKAEVTLWKFNENATSVSKENLMSDVVFSVYKTDDNNKAHDSESAGEVRSRVGDKIGDMTYNIDHYSIELPPGTYKIVETKAPAGYELSTYVFTVVVTTTTVTAEVYNEEECYEGEYCLNCVTAGGTINVKNRRVIPVTIIGEKKIDGNYTDTPTFEFTLQPVNYIGGAITQSDENHSTTVNGEGEFEFVLDKLSQGKTYYYLLSEVIGDETTGWTYDKNKYYIKVDVSANGESAAVTYYDKDGKALLAKIYSCLRDTYGTIIRTPETTVIYTEDDENVIVTSNTTYSSNDNSKTTIVSYLNKDGISIITAELTYNTKENGSVDTTVEYKDKDGNSITTSEKGETVTFTNKFTSTGSAKLPHTGGMGRETTAAIGIGCILTSGLILVPGRKMLKARKRK